MDAVLFDMDGVIVDTEEFWRAREAEVILPAAVADGDPSQDEIRGINYRETYDYLAERYEMALTRAEFLDLYESAAADLYDSADLMLGFEDLLADLRAHGVRVAIVSSSPRGWIDRVVERFDLDVDAVVSTEDVDGPGKPAPDVYVAAANRVNADPADCAAVEDSPNGVRAATRAGILTVAYGGDPEAVELADRAAENSEALRTVFADIGVLSPESA
jgi:HAD superfamily hydrolase (TIGR01509 family)